MAGAWEIIDRPKDLVVAILTREIVSFKWAMGLRNLAMTPDTSVIPLTGMPFDHARNTAVYRAKELGAQWLFFLDDDVIPPSDAIPRLIAHQKPIVSGLYFRRHPPILPVWLNRQASSYSHPTSFDIGLHKADLVGAGCLLIRMDVFNTVPHPWFEWKVDRVELPELERFSEDFSFCDKAVKYGFEVLIDTSVKCEHIGLGSALGVEEFKPALT